MPQLLAIEWDGYEARLAVARTRTGDIVVEHAFCVALLPRDPGQTFADVNVGERIAAALAARGIGRMETLVSVGRASIELRLLTLPPASEEELPEMVRFQATRQFSTLGDDWPLDFVPVGSTAEGGGSVLAAAISPNLVEQIEQTCAAGGLKPTRFVLRPFAAASLLCRRDDRPATRVRMMVDLLSDEADLTVLIDRSVVFMRTVRLPHKDNADEEATELVGEIRRTMAAAQNQLGGQLVESLVLCSAGGEHAALQELLTEKLGLPVGLFDPFEGLRLDHEIQSHPPDAPGRFAPLLGLLLDEATSTRHAIDFLHPRKKPEPPSHRRTYVLAAATAGLLILAVLGYVWSLFAGLANEKKQLTGTLEQLGRDVKTAEKVVKRLEEIEKWTCGDVLWLDELRELSLRMPPAEEAIVEQFQATARSEGGGAIVLDGLVSTADVIERLERGVRDPRYTAVGTGSRQDDTFPGYAWRYHETISIRQLAESSDPTGPEKRESETGAGDKKGPADKKEPGGQRTAAGRAHATTSESAAAPPGGAS